MSLTLCAFMIAFCLAFFCLLPKEGHCTELFPLDGPAPEGASATIAPLESWSTHKDQVRRLWLEILGPFPPKVNLAPEIVSEEDAGDHIRRMVRYTTEEGCRVEAFVLVPKNVRFPAPGALVFHSTSSNNIFQPAGLADAPTRHLGLHMVQRGYVALCPRNFIFGYGEEMTKESIVRQRGRGDFRKATEALLANNPGWTGMGKMVWDGIRALDYLESLPEVDASNIVALGHSLGGKEALFIHAFDQRVKASVSSEGGAGLDLSNWSDIWYLGERLLSPCFDRDLHELIALGAPRPFMLIAGGSEDGVFSWPYLKAAAPAYAELGAEKDLVLLLHSDGHTIEPDQRTIALDWLTSR